MPTPRASLAFAMLFSLALMGGTAVAQAQKTEAVQPLTLSQKLAVLVYRTENLVAGRDKMVKAIAELDPQHRAAVCKATSAGIPADVLARMNQYAEELQRHETELTDQERAAFAAIRPKLATLESGKPFC